jgi:hypothetical protein
LRRPGIVRNHPNTTERSIGPLEAVNGDDLDVLFEIAET